MEWRLLWAKMRRENNDSCQIDDSDLKEMIDDVTEKLYKNYYELCDSYKIDTFTMKVGKFYPIKFLKKYQLNK